MNTKLRIGIDMTDALTRWEVEKGQFLLSRSIYTADILDGLCRNGHADQLVIFTYFWAKDFLKARFPGVRIVCVGNRVCNAACRITGKNVYQKFNMTENISHSINACPVDLVWNPFLRAGIEKREIRHRTVATIHDMMEFRPEEQPDGFKGFKYAVASADHLVTISEHVKKEFFEKLGGVPEDKISVIPNAIQLQNVQEEPVAGLSPGYILCVNGFYVHKNTMAPIRALDRIKEQTDCNLVLCGGSKDEHFYADVLQEIEARQLQDRISVFYQLPKAQVEWLYNHARLYVNPSRMEGFGRGPIEAALHGAPVLTSKETSLYEVTMGLLDYITDPTDTEEIAQDILRMLANGPTYDMKQAKEKYLKAYAPETVAASLWDVFEKTVHPPRRKKNRT